MIYSKLAKLFFGVIFVLEISMARADLVGHGGMIRDIDLSSDGSQVLTASFDYSAILWDFVKQKKIGDLEGHLGPVTSVSFVSNNRALTTSDDKSAILWDLRTQSPVFHLLGHTNKVMSAAISISRNSVVTGGWDSKVLSWDLSTGILLNKIELKTPVNSIVFLGNSEKIAIGGHNSSIYIFNYVSGKFFGKLVGHEMAITDLSASKDGKRLLSSSIDGSIKLWDVLSFSQLKQFDGHDKQVFSIEFVAGDKTAISSGWGGMVIHWDLKSGRPIKKIFAHKSIAWAVTASSDGRFIVSASSDETARIWHLESGDHINVNIKKNNEPKPWLQSNHPGAVLFKKCASCHAVKATFIQRSGPHLENIFGRKVGSVVDYKYSKALKRSNFIWDNNSLFELFNQGPDKFIPGTKMPIQRINSPEKLRELVSYLKELTSKKM